MLKNLCLIAQKNNNNAKEREDGRNFGLCFSTNIPLSLSFCSFVQILFSGLGYLFLTEFKSNLTVSTV